MWPNLWANLSLWCHCKKNQHHVMERFILYFIDPISLINEILPWPGKVVLFSFQDRKVLTNWETWVFCNRLEYY